MQLVAQYLITAGVPSATSALFLAINGALLLTGAGVAAALRDAAASDTLKQVCVGERAFGAI